jgi:putative hydrolase of the HAD superfamily
MCRLSISMASRAMPGKITTIAFDGDDTLWHNERIFEVTQARFATLLAPFAPTDPAAALNATEMRNLSLFGYGIKGFTLSMIETAIEATEGRIAAADIATIVGWAKEMLQHPIELLPGVRETVEALHDRYRLMLITKGDLFDQESKVARSGLGDLFSAVEIVAEKDEDVYRRILRRHDVTPDEWLMVGNSVRSDILPALAIGARAIHIPYYTTWVHERADVPAELHERVRTLRSMAELEGVLAAI